MPRRPRILEDGGIYHVYSRGNNRKWLFRDGEDFQRYKKLLAELRVEQYRVPSVEQYRVPRGQVEAKAH